MRASKGRRGESQWATTARFPFRRLDLRWEFLGKIGGGLLLLYTLSDGFGCLSLTNNSGPTPPPPPTRPRGSASWAVRGLYWM